MGKAIDLKLLFEGLIKQFGFGKLSAFKASNIQKRIPKYQTVKISEADLSGRSFYRGKYTGYSDAELSEVLRTSFFQPERKKALEKSYAGRPQYTGREETIYNGKLLHFRSLDSDFTLPPGTCRRLVVPLASEYGLVPELLTENIVRLRGTEEMRKRIDGK